MKLQNKYMSQDYVPPTFTKSYYEYEIRFQLLAGYAGTLISGSAKELRLVY